ncbi:cadmium- manganese-transporting P-type ATPase [Lacticaseibacillus zeae DSM 20178 = KCTC 3804]|uniref:Cadmium-manganese-transporting P-type ATPase n=1 Tax=Lacticaseibacillus zeae DSM 20178 = KCTC 3804 TaxID=1423816 RepID=A0A0R1ESA4_LACZE|nr:cadmium- manganese-transporting P-type ATPase [Lacticaseibacillus zeae DSM 20178 = KCTC 3804]
MLDKTNFHGLSQTEAEKRLARDGPNEVAEKPFNFMKAILSRLWEPSAWILEGALIVELLLSKGIQASFIVLMLLFAATNGAIQSRRANVVLRGLAHDLTPTAIVNRDGKWTRLAAQALVVDDIINLRQGNIIPADVRLLKDTLKVDESTITGESKAVTHIPGDTAYAGTEVLAGNALAVVTSVGAASRTGKTISLVNQSGAPGHLQKLLGKIINYLAVLDAILAVILIIVAVIRHENLVAMLPVLGDAFYRYDSDCHAIEFHCCQFS